jgi:hypothetical protein
MKIHFGRMHLRAVPQFQDISERKNGSFHKESRLFPKQSYLKNIILFFFNSLLRSYEYNDKMDESCSLLSGSGIEAAEKLCDTSPNMCSLPLRSMLILMSFLPFLEALEAKFILTLSACYFIASSSSINHYIARRTFLHSNISIIDL